VKLWAGRFTGKTNPLMERFSASIHFDHVLFEHDIEGSKAHAKMLHSIGILNENELNAIIIALDEIKVEIADGKFVFSDTLEDIHMHIETRLIEKIGELGKKLHTGRSRNDQIALDMRMYLKVELKEIDNAILELLKTILNRAEQEEDVIMPGYTHMQRAQAVTFAHYLMAYYYMFKRDRERINSFLRHIDVLPLGSGALAGSTIPLDRNFVCDMLGFSNVSANSMDSVSDRDFVLDAVYSSSMIMVHISRLAEDLIIFSTQEFSFIFLPDEVCTGSSLMPHKKNPDALELARGKTSRVIGDLFSLFTLLKGLPMTYNRDLQEDKEPLFHAINTVKDVIAIMDLCIKGLHINRERMESAVMDSFMPAVEMTEYLTLKGTPFREAHAIVGKMVKHCEDNGITLDKMGLIDMKIYSDIFEEDVFEYIEPRNAIKIRKTKGAASFEEVDRAIEREKIYCNS